MPIPFEIDGGWPILLARALSVAALLSLVGTVAFRTIVLPRAQPAMPELTAHRLERRLARLAAVSLAASGLAALAWLALQAADMANAQTTGDELTALPMVVGQTAFGQLMAAQLAALLVMAAALWRGGRWLAFACAMIACALQAGHSHAASMHRGPSLLLVADAAHLLAAGLWLGALLPLAMTVATAPAKAGALAARCFSPLGKLCVVILAFTAAYQGWILVASIPGLVGTGYGWVALAKFALFIVLIAFALANRYWLAPALLAAEPARAKRALLRSLGWQTGAGLAVVAAAALLSSMPPAKHQQPVWPFADRFTLDTVNEDPDFRSEVVGALLALAGGGLLVALSATMRRQLRWLLLTPALLIAWFAVPHLDLLFVPAYPTSFFHSPTEFAAASIVRGAGLYPAHCAVCHGAAGHGDGPAATSLPVPPADLTAAHLWMHSDGELFWWLSHGIEAPEGGLAMPSFAKILTEDDRWALIDEIRGHNAGLAFRQTGAWPVPLQAPELQAACDGGRSVSLADLRRGFVRLVLGPAQPVAVPGLTTVLATSDPATKPSPGLCIARDETIPAAYAIVSGASPADVAGSAYLIDGAGWLRELQRPGAPGWNSPQALLADIRQLQAKPIAAKPRAMDPHMQM